MGQSNVVWSFAARGRGGDGGEVAIVVNIEDGLAVFEAGVFRMVMVGLDAVVYMVGEADLVKVGTDGVFTGAVNGVYAQNVGKPHSFASVPVAGPRQEP